jgi:hypothetical protein
MFRIRALVYPAFSFTSGYTPAYYRGERKPRTLRRGQNSWSTHHPDGRTEMNIFLSFCQAIINTIINLAILFLIAFCGAVWLGIVIIACVGAYRKTRVKFHERW